MTDMFSIKRELTDKFVPMIQQELNEEGVDGNVHVTHIETSEFCDIWHVVIRFDNIDLDTVSNVALMLKKYWAIEPNEGRAAAMADGRLASLGDGDDSQSAWFGDGTFRIWLRIWPLGEEYMNVEALKK